jgi:hypothetical protein
MRKIYFLPLLALGLFLISNTFAQKLTITANHSDAKFILLNDYDDSEKQELGTGTIEYKLEKNLKTESKSPNQAINLSSKNMTRTLNGIKIRMWFWM